MNDAEKQKAHLWNSLFVLDRVVEFLFDVCPIDESHRRSFHHFSLNKITGTLFWTACASIPIVFRRIFCVGKRIVAVNGMMAVALVLQLIMCSIT